MHDLSIRSFIAGTISVVFKDSFDVLYMRLGFSGVFMQKVAAGAFVSLDNELTTIGWIIGFFAHYTVGGVTGLLFTHYLCSTDDSYVVIKGVFAGLVIWLFLAGMLLRFGLSAFNPLDESSNLMLLLDHMIFGLGLGIFNKYFVFRYARPY